uniref:J domain-containing protein n=1 Tax=Heterorhabditis bacteriophora TaxID=37862 RepID=A0A1I7WMH0_HETBA
MFNGHGFRLWLAIIFICAFRPITAVGFAPELYCGLENCYDVLEIPREEFDRSKLSKIYRSLAKKYHPDKFKDQVRIRFILSIFVFINEYFQYFSAKQKYSEAIAYAMTVGKFRNMAINAGVERGLVFYHQCMSDDDHEDMLSHELWIADNFKRWKAEKDAEEQEKLAQSGRYMFRSKTNFYLSKLLAYRYKRYKRHMKNNAGTISFLDED